MKNWKINTKHKFIKEISKRHLFIDKYKLSHAPLRKCFNKLKHQLSYIRLNNGILVYKQTLDIKNENV